MPKKGSKSPGQVPCTLHLVAKVGSNSLFWSPKGTRNLSETSHTYLRSFEKVSLYFCGAEFFSVLLLGATAPSQGAVAGCRRSRRTPSPSQGAVAVAVAGAVAAVAAVAGCRRKATPMKKVGHQNVPKGFRMTTIGL